uniref:Uncharacterized protein n=1 Tax=Arundo donax TaxID=35708 RepID=A0A0A8ZLB6_ARUDO
MWAEFLQKLVHFFASIFARHQQ